MSVSLTASELREEVKLLTIRNGHLTRKLLEAGTVRTALEADLTAAIAVSKREEEEAKRSVSSKLLALRGFAEPLVGRLNSLLATAREEWRHGEDRCPCRDGHGPALGASKLLPRVSRWAPRDLEVLGSVVTALALMVEAQTTLAHRITGLVDAVTVDEQVAALLAQLEAREGVLADTIVQLGEATRERDALRGHAPFTARGAAEAAEGKDEVQAPATPSSRPVHVQPSARLVGFARASASALGATPSAAAGMAYTGRSAVREDGVGEGDALMAERRLFNSFLHELGAAVAPLESGKADVAGRGRVLWEAGRAVAREHRGADWDTPARRVVPPTAKNRAAELKAFAVELGRATGHNSDAIPGLIVARLWDTLMG